MKLFIIEGLDNTGKSTVISTLKNNFEKEGKIVSIFHCEKPIDGTPEEQAEYQNNFFIDLASKIIAYKKEHIYDVIILDRAWYGEYVYGQIYRNHDSNDIKNNISIIESMLKPIFSYQDLCFVLLNVDNIEFSISHDDGLSISNADKQKMILEQKMFEDVFNYSSIINKKNIIVNNGLAFKSREEIMQKIYE